MTECLKGMARVSSSSSKKDTAGRSLYQNISRFGETIGACSPVATDKKDFLSVRGETGAWLAAVVAGGWLDGEAAAAGGRSLGGSGGLPATIP
ncbi:Uncharacterized protein TCM_011924 [Theobroma cacao]|uniref:Uncharacterized protein n=1 Tax=Theobroma cacao TaxID=3641 RepID=A0A061ECW9_THECC|nr:Uncharacterized protein TCM_011924 [Theobroma cacao]